jgi:hypothetical protein
LGDTSVTQKIKSEPTVAQQLFDPITHQAIIEFLDERLPMMSIGTPIDYDPDQFGRRYANNVPYFVSIHRQLTEYASDLFGEKLKPSYSFLSMYETGGGCPLHIDRPQCYRTIDYLIRSEMSEPWPLLIGEQMTDKQRAAHDEDGSGNPNTPEAIESRIATEKFAEVLLSPNDAACYSGTHSWHYRPTRSTGKVDLVFFHFVPADFDGPLD